MNHSRSWWEQDLDDKEQVLSALYKRARTMESGKVNGLAGYLASCSHGATSTAEIIQLLNDASKQSCTQRYFVDFFHFR